jgi:undecaprenyl-diphosphatase
MEIIRFAILGIVQGLTEFFPVSSSGHLVLCQRLFGMEDMLAFDLIVHCASFIAVVVVFRAKIKRLLQDVFSRRQAAAGPASGGRYIVLLGIATVVTAAVYFTNKKIFESLFESGRYLWLGFFLTGCVLYVTRFAKSGGTLRIADSIIVGFFQGIAVAPGVSRSGMTIAACLFRKIGKEDAVDFSFLLGALSIFLAELYKLRSIGEMVQHAPILPLVVGFLAALISSFIALRLVIVFIRAARFHWFSYYCWFVSAVSFVLFVLKP